LTLTLSLTHILTITLAHHPDPEGHTQAPQSHRAVRCFVFCRYSLPFVLILYLCRLSLSLVFVFCRCSLSCFCRTYTFYLALFSICLRIVVSIGWSCLVFCLNLLPCPVFMSYFKLADCKMLKLVFSSIMTHEGVSISYLSCLFVLFPYLVLSGRVLPGLDLSCLVLWLYFACLAVVYSSDCLLTVFLFLGCLECARVLVEAGLVLSSRCIALVLSLYCSLSCRCLVVVL
jgi:hypothetical protein